MKKTMIFICSFVMIILSGCGAASTSSDTSKATKATTTPVVSPEASKVTPEPSPALSPTMGAQKSENPIDSFSDEDKAIIEKKFTFSVDPKNDKKITTSDVKDGTYEVKGIPSSYGHIPYVGLTIKDGQIVKVVFFQYRPEDKTYKDETYGKEYGTQYGEDTFEKAQVSVKGSVKFANELLETQDINKVDAVSGASYNLTIFRTGVNDALNLAKKQ